MPKPRNIAHVMHHLECIAPELKPHFARIIERTRYRAPEQMHQAWAELIDVLETHAPEGHPKCNDLVAVCNAETLLHIDLTKLHVRASGPCTMNEIAAYLHDQCRGIDPSNCMEAATYCVETGIRENWMDRYDGGPPTAWEYKYNHES